MLDLNSSNFSIIFDLVNLLTILILIFISFRKNLINKPGFIILILFSSTPLFGNDVFFDFNVFPDQAKYILSVSLIRDNYFSIIAELSRGDFEAFLSRFDNIIGERYKPVRFTSVFIASIPMPFVETVRSLGFFGKFIFIAWFIYQITHQQKLKKDESYYYYYLILVLPSILIYSSVGLKEIYILVFFHLCMFFILQRKLIYFIISLCVLTLLRNELIIIMIIFSIFYIFVFYYFSENKISRSIENLFKFLFVISTLVVAIIFIGNFSSTTEYVYLFIEKVNQMKMGYHMEGDVTKEIRLYSHNYILIPMIKDIFNAILTPTFSKSNSIFLNFFIIENYLLLILFIFYSIILFKYNYLKSIFFITFFFILNLSVGMFVINDMAIYRYKITMIIPLILIMREEILNHKNENIIFNKS